MHWKEEKKERRAGRTKKALNERTERKKVLLGLAKRNNGPGRQDWSKNESQWYPGKKLGRLGLPN